MPRYIHYFNPENDLALASGDAHYTPPASARQMARDLQSLPCLWAKAGDWVLLEDPPPALPQREGVESCDHSILSPSKVTTPSLEGRAGEGSTGGGSTGGGSSPSKGNRFLPLREGGGRVYPLPWGWSPLAVRQLQERGVPSRLLPTPEQMADYRAASSRHLAVRLLEQMRHLERTVFDDGQLVGQSTWCTTLAAVSEACRRYGPTMLKAPWSGSGRGLHPVREQLSTRDEAWVQHTLQRQGAVEAEPLYDRIRDFAMEFWAEHGRVSYSGLSLFATTPGGVYAGNLIAPEADKERILSRHVSLHLLARVRSRLLHLLSTCGLPPWYTGPLGVDMMIAANPAGAALHPLVEVNLRMTMGWVALQLTPQLPPGRHGRFSIHSADGHYHHEITFFDA